MNAFKRCTACSKPYTAEQWAALPLLGIQPCFTEDDKPYSLEMKNCYCGSTLAVEVKGPTCHDCLEVISGEVFHGCCGEEDYAYCADCHEGYSCAQSNPDGRSFEGSYEP